MKDRLNIAIHHRAGSFSDRWIEYCKLNKIEHQIVNCYDTNIIAQLKDFTHLLWPITQDSPADLAHARQIMAAAEMAGIKVFPNIQTCWHFDNKIAQKYLLESINSPLVPSYVFYDEQMATDWAEHTSFPKVFKLKSGAGSENVRLVKSKDEAIKLCKQSFGKGFIAYHGYFGDAKTKVRKIGGVDNFITKLKRFPRYLLRSLIISGQMPRERGYIYFQDFMPGNLYDTRITIIGNRAFGFTRDVRPNDFRASGSGLLNYDLKRIDMECVKIAFETAEKIKSQSMAFDFIKDLQGKPKIVEISYGFQPKAVYDCAGYWDNELVWHDGHLRPEDAMLEDLLGLKNK